MRWFCVSVCYRRVQIHTDTDPQTVLVVIERERERERESEQAKEIERKIERASERESERE